MCPKSPDPNTVDTIPDGYELFESPVDAIVHVRKLRPTRILPEELDETIRIIRRVTGKKIFYVLREGDALVVYWPDRDPGDLSRMFSRTSGGSLRANSPGRYFHPSRSDNGRTDIGIIEVCPDGRQEANVRRRTHVFPGDGFWLPCSRSMPLPALVESLCGHLGQESFYEIGM